MREMQQICVGLGDDDEKNYGNKLRSSSQKKDVGVSRVFVQRSRSVLREVRVVFVDPTEIFTEMETQKRLFEDKTQRRVESGYFLLARSRRFFNRLERFHQERAKHGMFL